MSKKFLALAVLSLALVGGYYFYNNQKPTLEYKTFSPQEIKTKLETIYETISGFGIPDREVKFIKRAGGAATYGEITFESAQKLLDYLKLTKDDVFYDLGSGVGKFVLHTHLNTPVKKSCGVELSGTRHMLAVEALEKAKKMNLFDSRNLVFLNKNIIETDLSDATVVFMCATCYSDDLMKKIADKLAPLGPKVRIASLREFKNDPRLKRIKTLKLPMTWSQEKGSNIYVYQIEEQKV